MFGISFLELVVIGLLALIVLGPEKLPEVARWAGKGVRELRQISNSFRDALMIDDLGGTSRSKSPKIASGKNNSPPAPSIAPPQTPAAASAKDPALNPPYPSTPPVNLDQLDDDHFERLLAEQYQLHHNQLRKITLSPRKNTPETHPIPLQDARPSTALHPVLLSPSLSLELAS